MTRALDLATNLRTPSPFTYSATAGQTTFTGADTASNVLAYVAGITTISVYVNGVRLAPADFTATDGTSVVVSGGVPAGSLVLILVNTSLSYGVTSYSKEALDDKFYASLQLNSSPVVSSAFTFTGRKNLGVAGSGIALRSTTPVYLTAFDSGREQLNTCATDAAWTLPAASSGAVISIDNRSMKTLTVNAAAGDTIEGSASKNYYYRQSFALYADGTNTWYVIGLQKTVNVVSDQILSSTASLTYTLPDGYDEFEIRLSQYQPVTNGSALTMIVSFDNQGTWRTGGSDYYIHSFAATSGSTGTQNTTRAFMTLVEAQRNSADHSLATALFNRGRTGEYAYLLALQSGTDTTPNHTSRYMKSLTQVNNRVTDIRVQTSSGNIQRLNLTINANALPQ